MIPEAGEAKNRRYLKTREKAWPRVLARWVQRMGLTPNAISIISIVFAVGAMMCLMSASCAGSKTGAALLWFGAAACIQLRLLCNLIDGLVAIEGGMQSPVGAIYNDAPDRLADVLILVGAGYSNDWVVKLWGVPLGWTAASLALMTAYIRLLGGTLLGEQSFMGPMAKQHRMAVLTAACLGSIPELWVRTDGKGAEEVMRWGLAVIVVGSAWTCWRRLRAITQQLRGRA